MLLLIWEIDITDTSEPNSDVTSNPSNPLSQNHSNASENQNQNNSQNKLDISKFVVLTKDEKSSSGFEKIDLTKYLLEKNDNIYHYRFKDCFKCSILKYENQIVWEHDFDLYGYYYPREIIFTLNEIDIKIKNYILSYTFKDNKWLLNSKTSFGIITHKDFAISTMDTGSNIQRSVVKINDTSQFDIFTSNSGLIMFIFKPGTKCVKLIYKKRMVWKYNKDKYNGNYPESIVYNPDGHIYIDFDPYYYVYVFDYESRSWTLNTDLSYKNYGFVNPSEHPSSFTIITADDLSGTNLKINDTNKYKLYNYFEGFYLYIFNFDIVCHEFRFKDTTLWKYNGIKHPRSILVDLYESVIDIEFGSETLRFRLSGLNFISYTVMNDLKGTITGLNTKIKLDTDISIQDTRDHITEHSKYTKTKLKKQPLIKSSTKIDTKTVDRDAQPIKKPCSHTNLSQPTKTSKVHIPPIEDISSKPVSTSSVVKPPTPNTVNGSKTTTQRDGFGQIRQSGGTPKVEQKHYEPPKPTTISSTPTVEKKEETPSIPVSDYFTDNQHKEPGLRSTPSKQTSQGKIFTGQRSDNKEPQLKSQDSKQSDNSVPTTPKQNTTPTNEPYPLSSDKLSSKEFKNPEENSKKLKQHKENEQFEKQEKRKHAELNIKKKENADHCNYSYDKNNKTATFEAKQGYGFNLVKQNKTEIWKTNDEEYCNKVDVQNSEHMTITLVDNSTKQFEKTGGGGWLGFFKSKTWTEITPTTGFKDTTPNCDNTQDGDQPVDQNKSQSRTPSQPTDSKKSKDGKQLITLDIKDKKSCDKYDYSKDDDNETYTAKNGYGFNKIIFTSDSDVNPLVLWEPKDKSEYETSVTLNDPKHSGIFCGSKEKLKQGTAKSTSGSTLTAKQPKAGVTITGGTSKCSNILEDTTQQSDGDKTVYQNDSNNSTTPSENICSTQDKDDTNLITLDIKDKKSCDKYDYSKDDDNETYTAKNGYGFNKIIFTSDSDVNPLVLWEAKDKSEYETSVEFKVINIPEYSGSKEKLKQK